MQEGSQEKQQSGGGSWLASWLAYGALVLPAYLFIAYDYLHRRGDLSSLVAQRLYINGLVCQDQVPYIDFIDLSQPIVYELFKFPPLLHGLLLSFGLACRLEEVVKSLFLFLTLLSSLAAFFLARHALKRLAERPESTKSEPIESETIAVPSEAAGASQQSLPLAFEIELAALPFALAPVLLGYMARFQIGEVQYLMGLAAIPWLLMRYLAYRGIEFSVWLSLSLGAVVGLAFSLEYPYILVPLVLELFLVASFWQFKPVLSYNLLGYALSAMVVFLRLRKWPEAMQKAYFEWIIPLRQLQFGELDEMIQGQGSSPDLSYVFYFFVAVCILYIFIDRRLPVLRPAIATGVVGLFFFILEKQGFTRDIVLAMSGLILSALLCLAYVSRSLSKAESACRRFVTVGLSAAVVLYAGYFAVSIEHDYSEGINPHPKEKSQLPDVNLFVQQHSQWQHPVAMFCDYPDSTFPLLLNLERSSGTMLVNSRPIRLLMKLERLCLLDERWKRLKNLIVGNLEAEFSSSRADLVLVHGCYLKEFMEANGLLKLLRENYSEGGFCLFQSDNRQPREFLGYYFGFDSFMRRNASLLAPPPRPRRTGGLEGG
ncbi:MAG: hypothetical protein J0M35_08205 [Candidatus Obscuribacter phosphatis]|uniref:Uncharacterized protein n=1 Tax=Candidatus Obscuribacter phosphatis TaxID=1906157 RepID=A0A8J7PFE8_9BACT|nr:hypothetical protein [Candidatus Obscuribacter phosphatis]